MGSKLGRGRVTRVTAGLALIAAALLTVVAWSTSSPVGSFPDEDFHLASIWCPSLTGEVCNVNHPTTGRTEVEIPKRLRQPWFCYGVSTDESAACSFDVGDGTEWWGRVNDGEYLGIYYTVLHNLVGPNVFRSVVAIRLFNGTLAVLLIGAIAALLPQGGRRWMALSVLPVSVPFVVSLISSVNPSSWAVSGTIAAWFSLNGALRAPERWRRVALGSLGIVGAAMAAVARADAAAFLVVMLCAVVALNFYRSRRWVIPAVCAVAVVILAAIGFLGAANSGSIQSGFGSHPIGSGEVDPATGLPMPPYSRLLSTLFALPAIQLEFFSQLAQGVQAPSLVYVFMVATAGGVFFAGLRTMNLRKAVALSGTMLVYVAIPIYFLQLSSGYQSRYTLPLVPVILAIAVSRAADSGWSIRLTRTQAASAYILIVVAHSVALHTFIRRYVTGLDVLQLNLNAQVEWWHAGPSPMATWLVGSLAFAALGFPLVHGSGRQAPGGDVAGEKALRLPATESVR
ncbi:DUF2142 domain-containing protein [Xylanimonas protaetiae]|uniref:DUF2142 domain-containing protein n=1 Tax=Xylanimonas protaetiae TaxID=2509457 RepID=A0A4P6F0G3_9MICO|nr:DUF2142 domain-containing protein [Xylanimonas protaetiae]QAY68914.1 DUF2142 domain-containing protein [Xylanimonas protaetiae]